jgi:hypothetical protein
MDDAIAQKQDQDFGLGTKTNTLSNTIILINPRSVSLYQAISSNQGTFCQII